MKKMKKVKKKKQVTQLRLANICGFASLEQFSTSFNRGFLWECNRWVINKRQAPLPHSGPCKLHCYRCPRTQLPTPTPPQG